MGLRDLIGRIKDKASLSKATLISKPTNLSLHLAVLRATTHSLSSPPPTSLSILLTLGNSSRATASTLITYLISRLRDTTSATVALKCLITAHVVIARGPFILQDQISHAPFTHGHNHLNLSNFQDASTPATWTLSSWVRFYARYIESNLSTSKTLGVFVASVRQSDVVLTYTNIDLIKEMDSLVSLLEEMCKIPFSLILHGNSSLLYEIMGLLRNDYLWITSFILVRVNELRVRLGYMSFGELVELMSFLKRLEDVKDRLGLVFHVDKGLNMLWEVIVEMKENIDKVEAYMDGGGNGKRMGRDNKGCESARFGERCLRASDSFRFPSGRIGLNKFSFKILEVD